MTRSLVSPDDQRVTFCELFFDLVFVFSVTKIVGLLHDGLTWLAIGESILVFWFVWWGWTQFTWALNAADTTHPRIELAALIATGLAFFMAVGVPSAFHGHGRWFAMTYVAVRVLGLLVYDWVAWTDPAQRAAVRKFSAVSVAGLIAVLAGGFIGGTAQYALWGAAIVLDIVAAGIGGQAEGWNLHPEHFSERHGLFVIIALGESLIVAASGLTVESWPASLVMAAIAAVAVTGAMWWTYFASAKDRLEHALKSVRGNAQSSLARDAFSVIHFPMMCGVIGYAAVVEEILAHPAAPVELPGRVLLATSLVLFVGGLGLALRRAGLTATAARIWAPIGAGAVIVAAPVSGWGSLAIMFGGILAVAISESHSVVEA
jgi:low temperature requirement protein LtrA